MLAFFTDEPSLIAWNIRQAVYPIVPWHRTFPEKFMERFGYPISLGVAAVVVLIVSAALTSIYMLAPAVSAYAMPLSPDSGLEGKRLDPGWRMQLPLILLVIVMLILVFASAPLAGYLGQVAAGLV